MHGLNAHKRVATSRRMDCRAKGIASHGAGRSRKTASAFISAGRPKPDLQTLRWLMATMRGARPCASSSSLQKGTEAVSMVK